MQKNANETAKETKNMFLQSAKELKAVTTFEACNDLNCIGKGHSISIQLYGIIFYQ
jgi:hypothetical protein